MSDPSVSRLATLLSKTLISTKDRGFLDHLRWYILFKLWRIVLRFGDPTIEYEFCGLTLRVPLSHALPFFRRDFLLYSDNLGRIAGQLFAKFGAFTMIDVGANVGDTVAAIHQYAPLPILCIEGLPKFSDLLVRNVASTIPVPVIEASFVRTSDEALIPVVQDGTAKLAPAPTAGSPVVPMKSFDQILAEHPEFQNSRLLKIDTDGMDIAILDSALDWISRQKPVLFFEYDPDLQRAHGVGGIEILEKLKRVGYRQVLVYEGHGDYMFSAELENISLFCDLHEYLSGRNRTKWCDLCIFHGDDDEIAEIIRRNQLDVFRAARQFLPAREPDEPTQANNKFRDAQASVH